MSNHPEPRHLGWWALGLLLLVELLFSSRWWPPEANPWTKHDDQRRATDPSSESINTANRPRLKALLAVSPRTPVWFAPYGTYPEPGMLESVARRGVYDTLLALPVSGPVVINYGAPKLTPADTLFSLASAQGLGAEWNLARHLGYGRFALDLGAVTQPQAAAALCLGATQCTISRDGYALFAIPAPGQVDTQLGRRLAQLQRRIPLLPYRSAGASWGPLVFNPLQWRVSSLAPSQPDGSGRRLRLQARPGLSWEVYRYPLVRYPQGVHQLLALRGTDVQLLVPAGVTAVRICIDNNEQNCQTLTLRRTQRTLAIGDLLQPGHINRIALVNDQGGAAGNTPDVELRLADAAQALFGSKNTSAPSRKRHQPQVLP